MDGEKEEKNEFEKKKNVLKMDKTNKMTCAGWRKN